jgi:hypothetical protein
VFTARYALSPNIKQARLVLTLVSFVKIDAREVVLFCARGWKYMHMCSVKP